MVEIKINPNYVMIKDLVFLETNQHNLINFPEPNFYGIETYITLEENIPNVNVIIY